jgi:polyphosphate kinase 2 (PPK2 family)
VEPGKRIKLDAELADSTPGIDEETGKKELASNLLKLAELQYKFFVDGRCGLLIVLQAIDAGGKDSTIRHVMTAFNPQGCSVTSFKVPSAEEARHDFLWRIHKAAPARGDIAVFNRSHYEDVLVVRVDKLVKREVWSARYDQINAFEQGLAANGIRIVKFLLHISKDEQRMRFESRIAGSSHPRTSPSAASGTTTAKRSRTPWSAAIARPHPGT